MSESQMAIVFTSLVTYHLSLRNMLPFILLLASPLILLAALAWLGSNYLLARRQPDRTDSPANYGLSFEEAEFQAGDRLTLRGWYVPAGNSTRTIIICSGANGSMDADVSVAPWLHAANFNVLLFDWRAHGNSGGEVVTLGFNERYDLIAAVEFAKAKGAQRIGVLGFSMGGAVALTTAAAYPDIHVVAADSAFVYILSAVAGGLKERGLHERLSYFLARLFLVAACARTGRNLFEIDPVRWVAQIAPRPLLLIYGEQDPFVPKSEVDLLIARAGETLEVWRVPEAAHRNIQDHRPAEYRRMIGEFFVKNLT